jgi:hypothetical protein
VFNGVPADTADATCTRIYIEYRIQLYDIEFVQDADGCRKLREIDRVPVVVSGATAANSTIDNVNVIGGTAAFVVRGQDSSIFEDRVAANVDVDNLLLRGVVSGMRWRDCSTDTTALECANITAIPGISLAMARADGNVVVDECPYGSAELWACSAGRGRLGAQVLVSIESGEPMYDWATQLMPESCSSNCTNATGTYCYQGYAYSCVGGVWTADGILEATEVDNTTSFGKATDKIDANNYCVDSFQGTPILLEDEYPWGDTPPCAPHTEAFMSTGIVIRAESDERLAESVLQYIRQMQSHQRCSTLGCPGNNKVVLDPQGFWRCGLAEAYVEDSGWWEWHYHPEHPLVISGVHNGGPDHYALPYQPLIDDVTVTSPEVQQGQLQVAEGECMARDGTKLVQQPCSDFSVEQNWLFVRIGAHFRLEVPNDPYTCLVVVGSNATAVLLPCPPCLYGSSAPEVSMNTYSPMPRLSRPETAPAAPYALVQISTDAVAGPALTVDTSTGLCRCAEDAFDGLAADYSCACTLVDRRKTDVTAQLGASGCDTAAGALLAACERLGAGLAGVDGTRATMEAMCARLGTAIAEVVGATGLGATVRCVGSMLTVVTMGGHYEPSEPLELVLGEETRMGGLSAITSKIIYMPHRAGMPTTITAPHRTVVNASGFLAAFGDDLYRITTEGFSTGGVVWAGVITELVICTVALILHCAFAATSSNQVAAARERVSRAKKET